MLLLLACTAPTPGPGKDDEPSPTAAAIEDLTATLAEMPTVLHVRWRTEEPTLGTVTATADSVDPVVFVEAAATTDHDVLLAGFPAHADVTVSVSATTEGGDTLAGETAITTGALPTWLPDVTLGGETPDAVDPGFVVTSIITTNGGGVVVYDTAGRPVWAHQRDAEKPNSVIRARRSLDGTALLYNQMAEGVDLPGLIVRVPLDGSASTDIPLNGTHTDFVELPTGGYAALGWEIRWFGERQILGDTIVEVDAGGNQRVVWSAFDDFTPDLTQDYGQFLPDNPDAEDWSHINWLFHDPTDDTFYVTITSHDAVAKIDRVTGDLLWWVSDDGGDFARVGEERLLSQPHSAQPTEDGLVVFNRGDPLDRDTCSGVGEIALDPEAGTAEITSRYGSERCLLVTFLGGVERLPGGDTLVSWSTAGQLDQVTPEGELAWRLSTAVGAGFGYAMHEPVLGPVGTAR